MNRRTHTTSAKQFRSQTNEDGSHHITGYAALFDVLSNELWPGTRERIAKGAFDSALPISEVTCNINHDDTYLLGRTSSGTLALSVDELGLKFDVTLPDTSYARDLGELMKRGDLSECSFAFTVSPEHIDVERVSDTDTVETIRSVSELFDVSVVCRGAYSQTFSAYRDRENHPQHSEVHEDKESENTTQRQSESHKANDTSIPVALALLDLQDKSIEV